MKCSNCGHGNVEGSKYCNQCGCPLTDKKVTLGGYSSEHQKFISARTQDNNPQYVKDESRPFYERRKRPDEDGIYDPDFERNKPKKSVIMRMTLVILLALFVFVAYNAVKIAVDTQQERIAQAEIKKQQQALADELKQLENYREKFNTVVESYESQSKLIEVLSRSIKDVRVISLIHKYLNAGVIANGVNL